MQMRAEQFLIQQIKTRRHNLPSHEIGLIIEVMAVVVGLRTAERENQRGLTAYVPRDHCAARSSPDSAARSACGRHSNRRCLSPIPLSANRTGTYGTAAVSLFVVAAILRFSFRAKAVFAILLVLVVELPGVVGGGAVTFHAVVTAINAWKNEFGRSSSFLYARSLTASARTVWPSPGFQMTSVSFS